MSSNGKCLSYLVVSHIGCVHCLCFCFNPSSRSPVFSSLFNDVSFFCFNILSNACTLIVISQILNTSQSDFKFELDAIFSSPIDRPLIFFAYGMWMVDPSFVQSAALCHKKKKERKKEVLSIDTFGFCFSSSSSFFFFFFYFHGGIRTYQWYYWKKRIKYRVIIIKHEMAIDKGFIR